MHIFASLENFNVCPSTETVLKQIYPPPFIFIYFGRVPREPLGCVKEPQVADPWPSQ